MLLHYRPLLLARLALCNCRRSHTNPASGDDALLCKSIQGRSVRSCYPASARGRSLKVYNHSLAVQTTYVQCLLYRELSVSLLIHDLIKICTNNGQVKTINCRVSDHNNAPWVNIDDKMYKVTVNPDTKTEEIIVKGNILLESVNYIDDEQNAL